MALVTMSQSVRGTSIAFRSTTGRSRARVTVTPKAVGWDPESVLGAPASGHIQRRMMEKAMGSNKEYSAQMKVAEDKLRTDLLIKREARKLPETPDETIEFFLSTEAADLAFEVARNRPRLDEGFFHALDSIIGQERFAARPNEDRLAELQTLRKYLEEAVEAVDKATTSTASAQERLKTLLSSPDKKQCILDMAGENQIDQALCDLLQQNIDAARMANQTKPAEFMEKVLTACKKFLITV
jgi:hypothetical protein